jgi:hypothetical protein
LLRFSTSCITEVEDAFEMARLDKKHVQECDHAVKTQPAAEVQGNKSRKETLPEQDLSARKFVCYNPVKERTRKNTYMQETQRPSPGAGRIMILDLLISEMCLIEENIPSQCVHVYYMFILCILNSQPTQL